MCGVWGPTQARQAPPHPDNLRLPLVQALARAAVMRDSRTRATGERKSLVKSTSNLALQKCNLLRLRVCHSTFRIVKSSRIFYMPECSSPVHDKGNLCTAHLGHPRPTSKREKAAKNKLHCLEMMPK